MLIEVMIQLSYPHRHVQLYNPSLPFPHVPAVLIMLQVKVWQNTSNAAALQEAIHASHTERKALFAINATMTGRLIMLKFFLSSPLQFLLLNTVLGCSILRLWKINHSSNPSHSHALRYRVQRSKADNVGQRVPVGLSRGICW